MLEMTEDEIRHCKQNEKLLDELVDSVILHHASKVLRHRIAQILYKHIPFMDEGCYERGCPCVDDKHSCLREVEKDALRN
jgi:hypothetical protein